MGRSLRSQTKKRFRAIKREQVFGPVEDARLQRLALAQAKEAEKPKVGDFMEAVDSAVPKDESAMDIAEGGSSAGGMSNRQAKRLKMAKKAKRQKTKAKKKANKKTTTF
ncbi:hypothetical protein BX666DRAFT_1961893 [Dichotomocladium elegans]|nr:hypothetical protein BX666DRAFT_1961893 [Dichotomocladium elegans]